MHCNREAVGCGSATYRGHGAVMCFLFASNTKHASTTSALRLQAQSSIMMTHDDDDRPATGAAAVCSAWEPRKPQLQQST